jgi:hypothetical protein
VVNIGNWQMTAFGDGGLHHGLENLMLTMTPHPSNSPDWQSV